MAVWSIPAKSRLLWERFDNGCLIFCHSSGTTHLLADPAPDILQELQLAPATVDVLLERLGLGTESPAVKGQILTILQDLDRLGLIRPGSR